MLYIVTWIPSIYPLYVSIYTSTMDPMGNITTTLFLSLLFLTNVNGETRPWMTVVCTCSGDEVGKQFSGLQCSCQCTLDAGLSKHSVPDAYRFPYAAKLNGDLLHV